MKDVRDREEDREREPQQEHVANGDDSKGESRTAYLLP